MQYRKFGKLDWNTSILGFGAMRFPTINNDYNQIDEVKAKRMLHYAIDHGVNYIDTAYPYHGGDSELFLGKALQDGYRQKIRLVTKLPSPLIDKKEDFNKYLNEQLKKLKTDYIDFYLLHGINRNWWPKLFKLDVLNWAEKAIADGRIGHLGFSFHDEYPIFKEIIDTYNKWDLCMIQYNYMGINNQAGIKGLKYASSKGIAIVIMEPLFGGRLSYPPLEIKKILNNYQIKRTPTEWAFRWLWSQPEISVVLSGMNTIEQVQENINSADNSNINGLKKEEIILFNKIRKKYFSFNVIPCTNCSYCIPCLNSVDIPYNFKIYNDGLMFEKENPEIARTWYRLMEECLEGDYYKRGRADRCTQCHKCEEKCPQNISISKWLSIVDKVLGHGESYKNYSIV